ncbi:MAG: glycosyltransferase [Candidatus Thermoplasmatota archaeon]|nr:glycosyltransferase [Candidatus Thermoplasmatota archaeon]
MDHINISEQHKKIIIFNWVNSREGIGRYTRDLYIYSQPYSEMVNFIMRKEDLKQHYDGTVVEGFYPPFMKSGFFLNHYMFKYIFRKRLKEIKRYVDKGLKIHYSFLSMPPVFNNPDNIITMFDLIFLKYPQYVLTPFMKLLKKHLKIYKEFNNVIAISNYVKKDLINYGFTGNIEVIYPPVSGTFSHIGDKAGIRKKLKLPLDKKLVLSVSSTEYRKNLSTVYRTIKLLGPEYRLIRIGEGSENSINFRNVDDNTINMIYNASDVLLFPTLEEGFGYPVTEAFATGLPVVSSNIEVIKEIAYDAAILVEPTASECVRAVKEAINNSELLQKKGFERVRLFSTDKFSYIQNANYKKI